jgi:hypothetical protein
MRVMPSEGSGRYWPDPDTEILLKEKSYQEIRLAMGGRPPIRADFFAIESVIIVEAD